MADQYWERNNRLLKLRDLEDGTFAEVVSVEGTVTTAGGGGSGITGIDTENVDNVTPVKPVIGPGNEQTRFTGDPMGNLFMHPHPPHVWHSAAEYTAQQTDTILRAAPAANYALYITDLYLQADGIVTISLEEDGSPDVLKFRFYAKAAGDGVAQSFR